MNYITLALRRDIVKRSLIVTVIVGTILNLINQGDAIGDMSKFDYLKCLLTYLVPYFVSTYGSVTALMSPQNQS